MDYLRSWMYGKIGISDKEKSKIKTNEEVQTSIGIDVPEFSNEWTCEFWRVRVKLYDLTRVGIGADVDIDSDRIIDEADAPPTETSAVAIDGATPTEDGALVFNVYTRKGAPPVAEPSPQNGSFTEVPPATATTSSKNSASSTPTATIFSHGLASQFVVNRETLDLLSLDDKSANSSQRSKREQVKYMLQRMATVLSLCNTKHVIVYEYPLFGLDETTRTYGDCSELNSVLCLKRVIDFARHELGVRSRNLSLLGYSFGTGPSIRMARFYGVNRVVLLAPYTSMYNTAFSLPSGWKMQSRSALANADHIREIHCPIFIMHGVDDDVIDCNHSRTLFLAISSHYRKKSSLIFLKTGHYLISDFIVNPEWKKPVQAFLNGANVNEIDHLYTEVVPYRVLITCDTEKLKYARMVDVIVFMSLIIVAFIVWLAWSRRAQTAATQA